MAIAFVRALPAAATLGANANTITTAFDATGCDALVIGVSFAAVSGNVTGLTVTTKTYAGTALTDQKAFVVDASSTSAGGALMGILLPTTGSNNLILTMSANPSLSRIVPFVCGYSGVASFANAATNNPGSASANSPALNVTAASGNLAVCFGTHGSAITTAGASCTLRGVANNYATDTAGSCVAMVDRPGVGGATALIINSGASDSWLLHGLEMVAGGAAFVARRPLVVCQAVNRSAVR